MQRLSPDAPLTQKEQDTLRRWPLARTVYNLIKTSPREWSLRIGVYGRWGEGKTTVLKFIEELALADSAPVAWFNPWAVEDRDQLWASFSKCIEGAFRTRPGLNVRLKDGFAKLVKWGEPISNLDPRVKAVIRLASMLTKRFSISRIDVEEALGYQDLGDKKLVVLIDDLDRADPLLVPHLLLALREVFELPQCAFVLGLDPDVVAKALPKAHPGWGSTPEFLEKIVDFPFWLTEIEKADLLRLIKSELAVSPLNLNPAVLEEVVDLLPSNPRKLKRFLRGLWRFKSQIDRHGEDEVNWLQLLLIELLRSISSRAAQRLLESRELWSELLMSSFDKTRSELDPRKEDADKKWLEILEHELTNESDVSETDKKQFVQILRRMRDIVPFDKWDHIQYWGSLSDDPPVFTWKEFLNLFGEFEREQSVGVVRQLVSKQAGTTDLPASVVKQDLFKTTLGYRESLLASASESLSHEDMTAYVSKADTALSLVRIMIVEFGGFSSADGFLRHGDFSALLNQVKRWAHFKNDPAYVVAREKELTVASEAARLARGIASEIINERKVWRLEEELEEPAKVLERTIITELVPGLFADLRERFSRKDGIKSLFGEDRHLAEKYYLLNRAGGLYSEEMISYLNDVTSQAKDNPNVHENCVEFLLLLDWGIRNKLGVVSREDCMPVAKDKKLISMIWRGAIARRIQPRTMGTIEEVRKRLAEVLGGEELLPVPKWSADHVRIGLSS